MGLDNLDPTQAPSLILACVVLWELRQQRIERAAQELVRNKAITEQTKAYDRLTRWVVRISERLGFQETGPIQKVTLPAVSRTLSRDLPPDVTDGTVEEKE